VTFPGEYGCFDSDGWSNILGGRAAAAEGADLDNVKENVPSSHTILHDNCLARNASTCDSGFPGISPCLTAAESDDRTIAPTGPGQLMTELLRLAAAREAANNLYRSTGFTVRETNCCRHDLRGIMPG
jgi:hypothetical protein